MDDVVRDRSRLDSLERETMRRVTWRILPILMLGYFAAYLDRVSVGFAALTMNQQLGFTNAMFGFGAGAFFVGYVLAEIPSNLILDKVGARRWLARILITWGIIAGLTAFVWSAWSFYTVRFLLGLAEAGFFPGVILYLTWWFPSSYRTRSQALMSSASLCSLIIGQPISGLLVHLDGVLGFHGWQWLFVIETMPSIIMGFVIWQLMTDRPAQAEWLTPEQRTWLSERLASERAQREAIRKFSLGETFYNPRVWLLTAAMFCNNMASYGVLFFMPQIVKALGVPTNMIGLISGVPFMFALVAMNYWGRHSDLTGERTWHAASAWLLASAGMGACILIGASHPVVMMVALIFATMGQWAVAPVFWSFPTAILTGAAAAGGLAMINSVSNLGGWVGPWLYGLVKDATGGSDKMALLCLAAAPVISAIIVVVMGHDRRLEGSGLRH